MKKIYLLLVAVCLFLVGCGNETLPQGKIPAFTEEGLEKKEAQEDSQTSLSCWLVYWDMKEVEEELSFLSGHLASLSYFEAYFNEEDQVVLPEGFMKQWKSIRHDAAETYLTVVNDIVKKDGTSVLKDTNILYRLWSEDEAMDAHIEELVGLAQQTGVDGLEIDYERIRKDDELWALLEKFCEKAAKRLEKEGLKLRIILEPGAPIADLEFPDSIQIIIMCYNLHSGKGNEGPKADKEFLKDLANQAKKWKGRCIFALATGGFDWPHDENPVAVNERAASELAKQYDANISRDDKSQALTFKYKDTQGKSHEVWYADGQTLHAWMEWVNETEEYEFAIWRLNGNIESSVKEWIK